MGNNCCGPEQPDAQDNRVDVMLELMPRNNSARNRLIPNKSAPVSESPSISLLIPATRRSQTSDRSKSSRRQSRKHRPEVSDLFRLDRIGTAETEKLN